MGVERTHVGLAPDGRWVSVTCVSETMQEDWQWGFRLTSRTMAVGVTVARADFLDFLIEDGGLRQVQQVTYRGQSLTLYYDRADENWVAGLRSTHHSLTIAGTIPPKDSETKAPTLKAIVALLDQLVVKDVPQGLTLDPHPGSGITMWAITGQKVTDAGPITLYRRAEATGLLSTEPGLAVQGGEVWKKTLGGEDGGLGRKYVHAGETAVCMIDDDLGVLPWVTKAGQEQLLTTLKVSWG
ncbi:hypothetical protein [Nonomuraea cavernae]|uniref:hypothetical protein n=1 Tax=Nonomuraea cavernae TaxID=2045107 RepID=UPI0033FA924C